jgi:hypothetical protein
VPALVLLALAIADAAGGPVAAVLGPATLLVCYLLWARADILLFRS